MSPSRKARPDERAVLELTRHLATLLSELDLSEVEVSAGELRIRLARDAPRRPADPAALTAPLASSPRAEQRDTASGITIESPMVGTFYRAPSPTADPYVREGDIVKEGQILCIIEAMKLLNEIEAKIAGRVVKIYAENGQPVEYGEPLFVIDPAG
jgi:acetyl-CoA carboxylase biotin carboxyl carrier protein